MLPAATQSVLASQTVANLACARDYQFRVSAQNAGGTAGPSAPAAFTTAACATNPPQVAVAVAGTPRAGSRITLSASVVGGSGALRYEWDVDGDGAIDRNGPQPTLDVVHATAFAGNASVTVTDAIGAQGVRVVPLNIGGTAPRGIGRRGRIAGLRRRRCAAGTGRTLAAAAARGQRGHARVQRRLRQPGAGRPSAGGGGGEFIAGAVALDPPALAVGTLAAGATVDRLVAVQLSRAAVCGTSYTIQQDLGLDDVSFGGSAGRVLATLATPPVAQCQVFTGCVAAKATVVPRQGLYFDSDRGGNGISNLLVQTPQGTVYFGAWFTGASDRKPTWNIVQGLLVDNQIVAPVYRFSKRRAAPSSVDRRAIGTATITLLESERFLFAWTIGTRSRCGEHAVLVPGPASRPIARAPGTAPRLKAVGGRVVEPVPGRRWCQHDLRRALPV